MTSPAQVMMGMFQKLVADQQEEAIAAVMEAVAKTAAATAAENTAAAVHEWQVSSVQMKIERATFSRSNIGRLSREIVHMASTLA